MIFELSTQLYHLCSPGLLSPPASGAPSSTESSVGPSGAVPHSFFLLRLMSYFSARFPFLISTRGQSGWPSARSPPSFIPWSRSGREFRFFSALTLLVIGLLAGAAARNPSAHPSRFPPPKSSKVGRYRSLAIIDVPLVSFLHSF